MTSILMQFRATQSNPKQLRGKVSLVYATDYWVLLYLSNQSINLSIKSLIDLLTIPFIPIRRILPQIVFPTGSTIDPVTGKRCLGTEFIDDIQRKKNLAAELNPKSIGAS